MKKKNEEITLKDILGIFIPKFWIILLVAILLASSLAIYSEVVVEDTYTSYSILNIRKDTEALNMSDIALSEVIIENIEYRIRNKDFLNKILLYINQNYQGYETLTISQIASSISYAPLGNGILRISVTTGNQQLSFAIAQALENEVPSEFYAFLPNALKVEPYSSAFLPTAPNSKGTVRNALIGFVAGAFVSALVVWICSVFDVKIRSKKKIEDNFDFSVLGVIPATKTDVSDNILSVDSAYEIKESYNALVTNVMHLNVDSACKKIAVTSSAYSENKSVLAINLATSLAWNLLDKKVLLVDADMRSYQIKTLLSGVVSEQSDAGLSDFLFGNSDCSFNKSHIANLDVVYAGKSVANPSALINSEKMKEFIAKCEKDYDYIIIDTPPVSVVSDAVSLVGQVDGYIVSVKSKVSTVPALSKATDYISSVGATVYGVVLA